MTISSAVIAHLHNMTEKVKMESNPGYQGAVGERKDEDKEKIDAYKIDAYFGHTFAVKTLGYVCQSIQNKIWNMSLYEELYH